MPDNTTDIAVRKVAKSILAAAENDGVNSDEQAALFFTQVVQAFVLLDQIAPQFIELVEEYHSKPFGPREGCHLCKLRAAAEEYLREREKVKQ